MPVTRGGEMDRRGFLKGLSVLTAGVAVAPVAAIEAVAKPIVAPAVTVSRGTEFEMTAFYCPYIPLQVTSAVRNEAAHQLATNELFHKMRTRYDVKLEERFAAYLFEDAA